MLPAAVAQALRAHRPSHAQGSGVRHRDHRRRAWRSKRTHELIPFCHPLPIENCSIEIEASGDDALRDSLRASAHHKTGVEMEALTGASVAALTVYDMCKALSHDIVIDGIRLLTKSGGKRAVHRGAGDAVERAATGAAA